MSPLEIIALALFAFGLIGFLVFVITKLTKRDSAQSSKQNASVTKQKTNDESKNPHNQSLNTIETVKEPTIVKIKKVTELANEYQNLYFGSFKLKGNVQIVTAIDFKGSKVLLANTKNQLVMFNLKNWKKDNHTASPQKFFVSLDNNGASAVSIGQKYYYAALTFDKTIVIFEFVGENGVYFREISKFPRNIFKANPAFMKVSDNQSYIVTTGSESQAQITVWSMKGQKLAHENTYLIYNYGTSFGFHTTLIHGWTSQIKIYQIVEEKDGSFKKLQKKQHLAHEQSPLTAAIDNKDMYAISVTKNHIPKIWNIFDQSGFHRTVELKNTDVEITQLKPLFCKVYTFQCAIGHFKTLVILANQNTFIVTDTQFNVLTKVEGVEIKQLYMTGGKKSVILGTVSKQSQLSLWNLTHLLDKVKEVRI